METVPSKSADIETSEARLNYLMFYLNQADVSSIRLIFSIAREPRTSSRGIRKSRTRGANASASVAVSCGQKKNGGELSEAGPEIGKPACAAVFFAVAELRLKYGGTATVSEVHQWLGRREEAG